MHAPGVLVHWAPVRAVCLQEPVHRILPCNRASCCKTTMFPFSPLPCCCKQAHRFCSRCGAPSTSVDGGSRRQCTADAAHKLYPRTDPVVRGGTVGTA